MIEIGARTLRLPAPAAVVTADLTVPRSSGPRVWLVPGEDERWPEIVVTGPGELEWRALWRRRPDAVLFLSVTPDGSGAPDGTGAPTPGSRVAWRLVVDEPVPAAGLVGHLRHRVNHLLNADLRFTYGQ